MLHGKALLSWPFFADQFDNTLQVIDMGIARQVSQNLQNDIEHMFNNNTYSNRAKEIQKLVIHIQNNTAKEQIINIARFTSNNQQKYDEL